MQLPHKPLVAYLPSTHTHPFHFHFQVTFQTPTQFLLFTSAYQRFHSPLTVGLTMAPKPKAKGYPPTPSTRGSTRRQLRFTQPQEDDNSEETGLLVRTRSAKKPESREEPTGFTPLQMKTLKNLLEGMTGSSRVTKPTASVTQAKNRRRGRTMSVEPIGLTADEEHTSAQDAGSTDEEELEEREIRKQEKNLSRMQKHPSKVRFRQRQDKAKEKKVWIPGATIRFLPPSCAIKLDPARGYDFDGDSPPEPPAWKEIFGPQTRCGMTIDGTLNRQSRKAGESAAIKIANEPAFIRPCAKKPYYNYTDIAGRIIAETTIRFDNRFYHKSSRIKEALRLTRERRQLFIAQIKDIREELKQWRITRRAWELHLVETEYIEGNTQIFSPRFAAADIAAATNKVKRDDELDAHDKINMWFIGRPAREDLSEGEDLTLRTRLGDCETVIQHELDKLDTSEKELCVDLLGVPHSPAAGGTPQVSSGVEETDSEGSPTRPRFQDPVPPRTPDLPVRTVPSISVSPTRPSTRSTRSAAQRTSSAISPTAMVVPAKLPVSTEKSVPSISVSPARPLTRSTRSAAQQTNTFHGSSAKEHSDSESSSERIQAPVSAQTRRKRFTQSSAISPTATVVPAKLPVSTSTLPDKSSLQTSATSTADTVVPAKKVVSKATRLQTSATSTTDTVVPDKKIASKATRLTKKERERKAHLMFFYWRRDRHFSYTLDIPAHIKCASAQTIADFLDLSIFPGKARTGDKGIHPDYSFDADETECFPWGYPVHWMDLMKESDSCCWIFSKEGRTFASEVERWWQTQSEADRAQHMENETMDEEVVQSYLHRYRFMTRDELIADAHAVTLTAATD
jgi:hypothetical protein